MRLRRRRTLWSLNLADTGTGVNSDDLARVWGAFLHAKGEGTGTGLGLSNLRRIVEVPRDETIESGREKGHNLRITFPGERGTSSGHTA